MSGWTWQPCDAHKGDPFWNGTCTDCRTVWVDPDPDPLPNPDLP